MRSAPPQSKETLLQAGTGKAGERENDEHPGQASDAASYRGHRIDGALFKRARSSRWPQACPTSVPADGPPNPLPRRNLTKLGLKKFIKPYLPGGLKITRPNQVWCTDITYIPMRKGIIYLTAIMDIFCRQIVGWSISNSLSAQWCRMMLEEAIATHGVPEIINSDQGT